MTLPFSREQFFEVFARYNAAVWPLQVGLIALALACIGALFFQRGWDRAIGWALAGLWAWMGVAYHAAFFSAINPAAWGFGAAFLVEGALLAQHAAAGKLRFPRPAGAGDLVALCLLAYALVGYPLAGMLAGHRYPHVPTFGLPCPTTIFTLGLLALARLPAPRSSFVIPALWSVIGTGAAVQFGVVQDYGLLPAAAVSTAIVVLRERRRRHETASPASPARRA